MSSECKRNGHKKTKERGVLTLMAALIHKQCTGRLCRYLSDEEVCRSSLKCYIDECKWSIIHFLCEDKHTSKCQTEWLHDRSASQRPRLCREGGSATAGLITGKGNINLTLSERLHQLFGDPLHGLGWDLGPKVPVKWRRCSSLWKKWRGFNHPPDLFPPFFIAEHMFADVVC